MTPLQKHLEITAATAIEHERKVIRCIAMEFGEVSECRSVVGLKSSMFRDPVRRAIFAAAEAIDDEGREANIIELKEAAARILKGENVVEEVRREVEASFADSSIDATWSKTSAVELVKINEMRELFVGLQEAQLIGVSAGPDAAQSVVENLLDSVSESRAQRSGGRRRRFNDIVRAIIEGADKPNRSNTIRTGASGIDDITGGFDRCSLNIIAARPSVGKSTFAVHVARMFSERGGRVGFISLEMSDEEIGLVFVAAESGVSSTKIKRGTSSSVHDIPLLVDAANALYDRGIVIESPNGGTLHEVRSSIKNLVRREKVGLVVLDYLQLVEGKGSTDNERVSSVSRMLKASAKSLNVPIIALSQFSREVEKQGREPRLSDLRDSGALEQDADLVAFLHRPDENDRSKVRLIIAKNRTGEVGRVDYRVDYATRRFIEPAILTADTPKPVENTVGKKKVGKTTHYEGYSTTEADPL